MVNTGKIFKDSSNIYQDEAKVLFNYYQRCAEIIVSEEERIENEIRALETDKEKVEAKLVGFWNKLKNAIFFRKKKIKRQIEAIEEKIESLQEEHRNLFRDYKVSKLGVAYVPVADQIKYEDKCFIVDYSGNVGNSEVTLQLPKQKELLGATIQNVAQLASNVPLVESTNDVETIDTNQYSLSIQEMKQGDYTGKLDRSLRTISFCMSDLDVSSVKLPLVEENSDFLHYLDEYSTTEIPEGQPKLEVFDKKKYENSVNKFQELNQLKDSITNESEQFEKALESLMTNLAGTVQTISATKLSTTNKLINRSNFLLYQILKSPYNHYSPLLEADEIRRIKEENFDYSDNVQGYDPFELKQSSRVYYNIYAGNWVAEDGSTVSVPFGVHQMYEEIIAPVVQNLMAENRIERLKIYNHIHDQKVSYVNKWHQDVDAFYRSNHAESADIINNMQKTLSEYIEAYNILVQLQNTVKGMQGSEDLDSTIVKDKDNSQDTLAAFELQAQEFRKVQDDFTDFMDRLQDDITAKAEEFGHVEYYDARLRDGYSNKMAIASDEVSLLDDRRKQLAHSNPLLAKESKLPPEPNVEDITFEHLSINLPSMAKNALEELDGMILNNEPSDTSDMSDEQIIAEKENTVIQESPLSSDIPISENPDIDVTPIVATQDESNDSVEDTINEEKTDSEEFDEDIDIEKDKEEEDDEEEEEEEEEEDDDDKDDVQIVNQSDASKNGETSFFVFTDQQYGPYTMEQMQEMLQQQNINKDTLVWYEGIADWQPISNLPIFSNSISVVSDNTANPTVQGVEYFIFTDQQYGPYTIDQMKEMLSKQIINGDTLAWHEGVADWQPLSSLSIF